MPIKNKVDRICAIEKQINNLKSEKTNLEADILKLSEKDLSDTKNKSVKYLGSDGCSVTVTNADNVKIIYPSILKDIFGKCYNDVITEEVNIKIKPYAKKLLSQLYKGEYLKSNVSDIVNQITDDEKVKTAVIKKCKGKNFEKDTENLMKLVLLDRETAESYAYFISEAYAYEEFKRLLSTKADLDENKILKDVDTAIVVETSVKIDVCPGK